MELRDVSNCHSFKHLQIAQKSWNGNFHSSVVVIQYWLYVKAALKLHCYLLVRYSLVIFHIHFLVVPSLKSPPNNLIFLKSSSRQAARRCTSTCYTILQDFLSSNCPYFRILGLITTRHARINPFWYPWK